MRRKSRKNTENADKNAKVAPMASNFIVEVSKNSDLRCFCGKELFSSKFVWEYALVTAVLRSAERRES